MDDDLNRSIAKQRGWLEYAEDCRYAVEKMLELLRPVWDWRGTNWDNSSGKGGGEGVD